MDLRFEPVVDQPKKSDNAVSVCLYRSKRLSVKKHLEPFWELLKTKTEDDLLIFAGDGLEEEIKYHVRYDNVRVFNCGASNEFSGHHWRYFGSTLGYLWTWFRGTDTPHVPTRERRLQKLANDFNLEAVTFPSHNGDFYQCTGRVALSMGGCLSLAKWLKTTEPPIQQWHCDEMNLSQWHSQANLRSMIVLDRAATFPPLMEYITGRLQKGNQTLLIKDRNDTPR